MVIILISTELEVIFFYMYFSRYFEFLQKNELF